MHSTSDRFAHLFETQYLICNENTLCYRQNGMKMLGVLAASLRGHNPMDGCFMPDCIDVLRNATADDFAKFRMRIPPDWRVSA